MRWVVLSVWVDLVESEGVDQRVDVKLVHVCSITPSSNRRERRGIMIDLLIVDVC